MSVEHIQILIAQFADAAARAKRAGADAVEIHAGHGYILSAFMSPSSNRRDDAYGGSFENRMRLPIEVLRAVRTAVGESFPITVKIDTREIGKTNGITIEDAIRTARLLEQEGADAITASAYHSMSKNSYHSASNIPHEPATHLPYAARIKAAVGIPVIASGRIEVARGEKALRVREADFIGMGRKILADPHLPRKLVTGNEAAIRPCIYCYTCVSAIYTSLPVRCAVRPETGFEYLNVVASAPRQHVAVIGGGPAGMEVAWRLDALGHRVTLIEKGTRLGGTLKLAALAYEANEPLLDWLVARTKSSGVDVRLGMEASVTTVQGIAPDIVVVATGADRYMPDIPGNHLPHVFSGDDLRHLMLGEKSELLKGKTGAMTRLTSRLGQKTGVTANLRLVRAATHRWMPFGRNIVVIGGELVGLELAEFLVERGRKVTIVDDMQQFGAGLQIVRRMRLLEELEEAGVRMYPSACEIRIDKDAVSFVDAEGQALSVSADHVLVAKGARGDLHLADALRAAGLEVHVCGDCTGVGYIEGAMRGAAQVVGAIASPGLQDRSIAMGP